MYARPTTSIESPYPGPEARFTLHVRLNVATGSDSHKDDLSHSAVQGGLAPEQLLGFRHTHTHTHSHSLTHTHSHSLTHTHSHSLTLTHSHSLTHTHSLTLTHTHSHSLTLSHSHSLSLSLPLSLSPPLSFSLSLSVHHDFFCLMSCGCGSLKSARLPGPERRLWQAF